ncbi:putative phage abortive infection protein [Acinetobacter guillouiae]|uniref:putative phage abortive infection protein n=1 Tax=Acinetobacter guillouiae TaxID=106649 RepID=UPI003AF692EA
MSQENQKTNTDLDEIDKDINYHRIMIGLIIVAVIAFYLIMKEVTLTDNAQHWGTIGDFFGGILNPIFALFAFYWLTYSVRLQIKELKETRIELGKAAKAQEASAKHQEQIARLESEILELNKDTLKSQQDGAIAQQQQAAIQNFESLFFQLLRTKTDVTNDILVGSRWSLQKFSTFNSGYAEDKISAMVSSNHKVIGKESIKDHLILFKSYVPHSWDEFYTASFLDYAGSYFRISYQIVKLIDQNDSLKKLEKEYSKEYSKKQKEYFDIFRATFSQYELEAFFFNCLSEYGNDKFKKLLEKYGMFKPLLIDQHKSSERIHSLTRYAYKYDISIFEENDSWELYFRMIDSLKRVDINLLVDDIIFLYDYDLIKAVDNLKSVLKNELDNKKNNLEKVNIIMKYLENTSLYKLNESISNRLSIQIQYLKDYEQSSVKANENDKQFWLEKMDSTKETIQRIQQIKNIDEIKFLLISRIYPSEFLTHFGDKNS